MNKERFWQVIEEIKDKNQEKAHENLIKKLSQLEDADIALWGQIFNLYQKLSYKDRLWAAAYVIQGGCSDDGFDYFRAWLTAQGKKIFLNALSDPDSLAELEIEPDTAEFEDMLGVAVYAFSKKHNLKLFYDAYDAYDQAILDYPLDAKEIAEIKKEIVYAEEPDPEHDWESDDNKELKSIVPKLWAFYEKFYY